MAIPIPTPNSAVPRSTTKGSATAAAIRRAKFVGSSREAILGMIIVNSSPPTLARNASARTMTETRRANSLSALSPTAWPWTSLTSLQPSKPVNHHRETEDKYHEDDVIGFIVSVVYPELK